VVAIWQGILLWKAKSEEKQGPEIGESRPDQP
jgi:hypothetical protein